MKKIFDSVVEMVGHTPLLKMNNVMKKLKLKANILAKYANVEVELVPTRGLTTFYAQQNGIIVSFR